MQEPPIWPALLQLPEDQHTGAVESDAAAGGILNINSASMLYTGKDRRTADVLMAAILARNQSISTKFPALEHVHPCQTCQVQTYWYSFSTIGTQFQALGCLCNAGESHVVNYPQSLCLIYVSVHELIGKTCFTIMKFLRQIEAGQAFAYCMHAHTGLAAVACLQYVRQSVCAGIHVYYCARAFTMNTARVRDLCT